MAERPEDHAVHLTKCLAANLCGVNHSSWPRLIERFQDTLELIGFEGKLSLVSDSLVLCGLGKKLVLPIET